MNARSAAWLGHLLGSSPKKAPPPCTTCPTWTPPCTTSARWSRAGAAILVGNVASRPTPSGWVYRLGAVREFPADLCRHGWQPAWWLLRFRTSTAWLEHLTSDRYLSGQEFEQRYAVVFPGAQFQALDYAHAVVWHNQP